VWAVFSQKGVAGVERASPHPRGRWRVGGLEVRGEGEMVVVAG